VTDGRLRRTMGYLREMFPLGPRVLLSGAVALGFMGALGRVHGTPFSFLSSSARLGCFSALALMLMLRLMDDLKDRDIDPALFPERALPSGRVRVSDIRWALGVVVTVFLLAHLRSGWGRLSALLLLAYALLMFRHFFARDRLRKNLLLTLATHNPVIAVLLIHLTVLFAHGQHLGLRSLRPGPVVLLIVMSWSVTFSWEIARKIRSAEEENAYVTYSRILGRRGAVLLAGGAQTAALAAAAALTLTVPLSAGFLATAAAGYAVALAVHLAFLFAPSPLTSRRLKPAAEACVLAAFAAGVIDHGLASF
jgi:4-hydroxybenzoate polyprenyltransferase